MRVNEECLYRVLGGRGKGCDRNCHFADEGAIVYDIKTATPPVEKKNGWVARRLKEAEAAAAEMAEDSET